MAVQTIYDQTVALKMVGMKVSWLFCRKTVFNVYKKFKEVKNNLTKSNSREKYFNSYQESHWSCQEEGEEKSTTKHEGNDKRTIKPYKIQWWHCSQVSSSKNGLAEGRKCWKGCSMLQIKSLFGRVFLHCGGYSQLPKW